MKNASLRQRLNMVKTSAKAISHKILRSGLKQFSENETIAFETILFSKLPKTLKKYQSFHRR